MNSTRVILVKREGTGYVLRDWPAVGNPKVFIFKSSSIQKVADYVWANYPDQKVQWILI